MSYADDSEREVKPWIPELYGYGRVEFRFCPVRAVLVFFASKGMKTRTRIFGRQNFIKGFWGRLGSMIPDPNRIQPNDRNQTKQIQTIERFYEMKNQNRADEWSDESKSRLFGFLKYRRNRKMKNDRYSKSRLRDVHIKNMKTDEEFVTEFSVDGKYKVWLEIFVTKLVDQLNSMQSYL